MPVVRAWLAITVVAACSGKPRTSEPLVVDPCPLDDALEDEQAGCPDQPFSNDERILGVGNPLPCEVTRFDSTGFQLGTASYVLDAAGRLSSVEDKYSGGGASTITYHYDAAGRRTAADFEGRQESVHWTYERDAHGWLAKTTMVPRTGSLGTEVTTYERDEAGRTITIDRRSDDGESDHAVLTWRDGQLASSERETKRPDGTVSRTTAAVTRDAQGRRVALERTADKQVETVGFRYDPGGRLVELRGDGAITTIRYDAEGRVSEVHAPREVRRFRYCPR